MFLDISVLGCDKGYCARNIAGGMGGGGGDSNLTDRGTLVALVGGFFSLL